MKTFTIATIVALASVATAQLDAIPSCALSCLTGPLTSDGCASLTDFKCHCEKGASLLAQVQPCVQGACSAADQSATIAAVSKICVDAGAPIVIPDASAAPSAAPASSAAAVASSAAEVASSAAAVASSAAGAASSAVASAVSSLASKASSAVATPTGNGTASATPTVSQFTGAAAQATKAAGLIGAAALAMLAL
ncbi:hypothetical protein BKA66DRAFT_511522 [Pyrenochaeta sp. MPI-SDFR-AT-0127]|nr:hypothetical protein BKA66DRAFT_511522 [Pyrenochaeta sp. MPI-SDFR-AT-0127]